VVGGLEEKTAKYTAAELRYAFKQYCGVAGQERIRFYRSGNEVPPPWYGREEELHRLAANPELYQAPPSWPGSDAPYGSPGEGSPWPPGSPAPSSSLDPSCTFGLMSFEQLMAGLGIAGSTPSFGGGGGDVVSMEDEEPERKENGGVE
jgi:hypothetical protein